MSSKDPTAFDVDTVPGAVERAHGAAGLNIRDIASQFHLTYRALRFYESKGLLTPRHRDGRRVYSEEDRERLELLVWGKRLGFTLAEIGEMIENRAKGTSEPQQNLLQPDDMIARMKELTARRDEIIAAIAELRRHLAELD
ncbi:MerR family transcriptional regulator [Phreatobacter aquaticus]|uniref:MerR family transcriptional regulator n=1 Tax=Phreatobacter aquaticus TaxID=2570229 RepID=A0A4D7QI16_9HYPH|nr:MerR family transcriptional regulator [Phreatobacter aquaticus]QCK86555.1 MerR family transcriptional regulator [Phreatobacter aquaticus]